MQHAIGSRLITGFTPFFNVVPVRYVRTVEGKTYALGTK
jgi:hypothetical protein